MRTFLSGAAYPGFHKLVREYAARRKDPKQLNRLYAIESTPTTTGMKAEHRLGLRASEVPAFAAALAAAVGVEGASAPGYSWTRRTAEVSGRAGKGSEGQRRQERGDPGLVPGCVGSGAGRWRSTTRSATWARRSRYRAEPLNPLPSDQIARLQGPGGGSERGQGGVAGDSECQSHLLVARGSGFC